MFPTFKEVCDMLKQKTDLVEPIAASRSAGSHNKAQPTDFELCIDEVQSIAKLVKSGRLRNNLTQTALAKRTGLTTAEISRIEGGVTKKPTRKVLMALSPYTGIAYTRLLFYSGYSGTTDEELYYSKNGKLIPYWDIVDDIYKADPELLEVLANVGSLSMNDVQLIIQLIKVIKYENHEPISNDLKSIIESTKKFLSDQLSAIMNLFSTKSQHV